MRKEIIAAIMAIIVVASLGVGYLSGSSARGTETITSTSTSVSTYTTTSTSTVTVPLVSGATALDSNGSTAVDLILALNATTLKAGQSLNVSVSLFNALPSVNSVPASTDWPFQGVPVTFWAPCYFQPAIHAVVLEGNYTLQELLSVANFTIGYQCAEGGSVDHVIFEPESSQANLTGDFGVASFVYGTVGPDRLSLNFTVDGYWDLLNLSKMFSAPVICEQYCPTLPVATPFSPGVYTVAVADEWGQAAILHFTVKG
jgi:hypothetical protein